MYPNTADSSDEILVNYYRNSKDKNAVGELFKRHALMCFAVCNKYLKDEDASQDAAMQVFEKLFDDLLKHEIQNFKSWLHSVCRNHCLMQLRKPKLTVSMYTGDGENETDFMELDRFFHQEENSAEKEEVLQNLESAIQELNGKQKECISLFYLEQRSYEEVSSITGYTAKEVKSYIQNGKRNLKIILNNRGISLWLAFSIWIVQGA